MPAVMLPHWSLPPICSSQPCSVVQVHEVVGLQEHVAELGVAQAGVVALQPLLTESLASITLTGKCLPTSRRNSR